MTFNYGTFTEATTFASVFNRIPNGTGQRATVTSPNPGVYIVEVA